MIELYPEFYNDVFGPLMQPGSASHMAAPCRIGYLCNSLLSEEIADILVEMDENGSFHGTFGQMNEDLGMLNGAAGNLPDYPDFFKIKDYLKEHNITYRFDFCSMKESPHINSLKFILTGISGKKVTLVANSTGGGMIETVWVNGYAFDGKGDTYVLFIFDEDKVINEEALLSDIFDSQTIIETGTGVGQKGGVVHWFKLNEAPQEKLYEFLSGKEYAIMKPILPVSTTTDKKPQLFDTMVEWRRLAEEQGKTLYDVAIDYEIAASGWTREQVITYMRDIIKPAMYRRSHALYEEDVTPLCTPFTELHYKKWESYIPLLNLDMGVITKSIKYVMAGYPTIPGVLNVPGPMGTGGGFIYGVMSSVQEELGLSDDDVLRGLFIAAGIGAISFTRTYPTGEVIGCTGECGVCTAMASAAITEMLNGTPEQVEAAASMALQASIGWPCDPIPGGKDMPCMSRVLFIAGMSIVFSQWALSNQDPVLPFHEVVDVADKIGRSLPADLLCTARGGHCAAPTAQYLSSQFREWHGQQ